MSKRWREILLLLVSVTLSFVIVEALYRLYLRHRAEADLERMEQGVEVTTVDSCDLGDIVRLSREPDLFYELKPNLQGRFCGAVTTTNAHGMRMPIDPALAKPEGVKRVIGIGDSYLFAQRVDDGQGFLEVLQARALSSGRPIEVLNFGVPGYNTWMESIQLSQRGRFYSPDVVVVSVTGNDWDLPSFMLSRPYGDIAHSFLLGAIADRLRRPPELLRTPKSRVFEDHYLAVPEEVPEAFRHMVGFNGYRQGLLRMVEVAEQVGAKLVLFSDCVSATEPGTRSCTFPFKPGEYDQLRRQVLARPSVVTCTWSLTQDLLIPGDGHPTVEGHRSLAEQLRACIESRGVLLF
jgi:hypothetical protein